MHTVIALARQVAEALQMMDQIETPTYGHLGLADLLEKPAN